MPRKNFWPIFLAAIQKLPKGYSVIKKCVLVNVFSELYNKITASEVLLNQFSGGHDHVTFQFIRVEQQRYCLRRRRQARGLRFGR